MAIVEYETPADQVYKWTIRALYTTAIALNLWYLLEQYRETPEAERILSRVERLTAKVRRPWLERKHFRRAVNEVIFDAWVTVDDAARSAE